MLRPTRRRALHRPKVARLPSHLTCTPAAPTFNSIGLIGDINATTRRMLEAIPAEEEVLANALTDLLQKP